MTHEQYIADLSSVSEAEQLLRSVVVRGLAPYLRSLVHDRELQLSTSTAKLLELLGLVLVIERVSCRLLVRKIYRCEAVFVVANELECSSILPRIRPADAVRWADILMDDRELSLRGRRLLDWLSYGLLRRHADAATIPAQEKDMHHESA